MLGIPVLRVPGDATTVRRGDARRTRRRHLPDARSAVAIACRPDAPIEPDLANHDRYASIYEHYRAIGRLEHAPRGAAAVQAASTRRDTHTGEHA